MLIPVSVGTHVHNTRPLLDFRWPICLHTHSLASSSHWRPLILILELRLSHTLSLQQHHFLFNRSPSPDRLLRTAGRASAGSTVFLRSLFGVRPFRFGAARSIFLMRINCIIPTCFTPGALKDMETKTAEQRGERNM